MGYCYEEETGFYYVSSRYYDPEVGRFLNADGYVSTGTGILGFNMFAYCDNNPVNFTDPTGTCYTNARGDTIHYNCGYVDPRQRDNVLMSVSTKRSTFIPRKDKRKGSDKRQPSGERERNVGHPNGEEHSRVPKGNRDVRKTEALVGIIVTTAVIAVIVLDDITVVGVANDVMLAPTTVIWWDYATVLAH